MPLAGVLEKPPRTYSEVAASRPSSPVFTSRERMLWHPPPMVQVHRTMARECIPASAGIAFRNDIVPDRKSDLSELSELSDNDENPNPWIQVVPRHVHSLDSLSKEEKNKKFVALPNGHGINRAQKRTLVTRADRQLLFAQKEQDSQARRFERRIENEMKPCERLDPLVSHSEGLCNRKGESIEQNQASAVQEDDEFDVDAQCTMLKSINKIHCSKIQVQLNSDDEILVWERIEQPTRLYLGLRVTVHLRAPNTLTATNTKKLILDHL